MDFYPERTSQSELRNVEIRLLGTGAAAPTKEYGQGITVARTGVGIYTLTFTESQGQWAGYVWGLEGTTAANVKNHDLIMTLTSTTVLTLTFWNAAGTARDLAATEWINMTLKFVQSKP